MKTVTKIQPSRMDMAKFAYTTTRVDRSNIRTLLQGEWRPRSGDLVLARIIELDQLEKIELSNGRLSHLYPGDEVVVCYGNRYAAEQFEAVVPHGLEVCSLVTSGGIASKMLSYHESSRLPTSIEPVGLLGDRDGQAINLAQFSLPEAHTEHSSPFTIAVVGTSISSGNTETVANLVKGMSRSGLKVGVAKITGACAGGDVWHMTDAGATESIDFTHAGLPSTYLASESEVLRVFNTLTSKLAQSGVDVIVLDISDNVYQKETTRLLQSEMLSKQVDSMIFTASDAMGAVAGAYWLRDQSLPVMAISGELTRSPLSVRETRSVTGLPVLDKHSLINTNWHFLLDNKGYTGVSRQEQSNFKISIDRLDAIMSMPVNLTC
jgi:hypothetical protein